MDKISGIIPNSPRVASVDLKEASPVRPGTPSFGRPEGVSSLREMNIGGETTARRGASIQQNMMDWRSKEAKQAEIVQDISDKFFGKKRSTVEAMPVGEVVQASLAPLALTSTSSRPAGFKTDDLGSFQTANTLRADLEEVMGNEDEEPAPTITQPEGLFPKGSFINYSV